VSSGEVIFRHAEAVMGTVVSFDIRPRGVPHQRTRTALARACTILHRADEVFSLYKPTSALSRLRRGALTISACPPEVSEVLDLCHQAYEQSEGWFDPWALGPRVDPTGLVKGWAARQAADALAQDGIGAAMVNAAGDISVFGRPSPMRPWRVGVRAPEAPDRLLCVVAAESAVATSGTYERGDHVRDVRTGGPAAAASSATVCGPDLAYADAFATGLLAAGDAGLDAVQRAGYESLIVRPDGSLASTSGFPFVHESEPSGAARRTSSAPP
jgi:thiamine biosynthesis lipoprotein